MRESVKNIIIYLKLKYI